MDAPSDETAGHADVCVALGVLGLKPLEAEVLAAVLMHEELTNSVLCGSTGSGPQAVAAAVASLARRELVEQVTSRRPHVVFLHWRAAEVVERLVAVAAQEQAVRERQTSVLVQAVALAAGRRAERGRPGAERHGMSPQRRGRTSHDEVLEARWVGPFRSPNSMPGCAARLLVVDAGPGFDAARLAGQQEPGSEVRVTDEPLPVVRVLDGDRLMTAVGTAYGRSMG